MRTARLLPLLLLPILTGCGGESGDTGTQPEAGDTERFAASLNADNMVVGNIVSAGTGAAAFTLDDGTLAYTIDVADIDQVNAAHIHGPATTDEDANIILTLFAPSTPSTVNGRLTSGSVVEGSSQLSGGITLEYVLGLMRSGNAFVMVHSQEYPNGEIRGQVAAQ